jgi:PAS domain-containing protein
VREIGKRERDEVLRDYSERSSLRLGHGFHQLLGYQRPIQDDVVVERLIAMRGLEYPIGPETWAELKHEAASEWVTLLQLESSGGPGWDFVTGGKLFVVCRLGDVRERRFESLVNGAGDGVYVHDVEGRVLDANPVGCAMLGVRQDSDYLAAVSNAGVRGDENPLFSGRIVPWNNLSFFEHIVVDPPVRDCIGSPLLPKGPSPHLPINAVA